MTNCIFYSIIFTLFLNFTVGSIRYSGIHRAFMSIYRGIFEASVSTVDKNGNPVMPYYYKPYLENYIKEYFEDSIKKFTKEYTVNYEFYKTENEEDLSRNYYRNVRITLNAKINSLYSYNKTQSFSIQERGNL